jgi:hypothetical protein
MVCMNVGLVHRVTISRESPTGGEDEWGVPVEAVEDVALDVPSLVQARSSRELPRPEGVEITDALIFLPYGTNVRADDLIAYGAEVYRVVGIPADAGGAGHHIEVAGRRVHPGG